MMIHDDSHHTSVVNAVKNLKHFNLEGVNTGFTVNHLYCHYSIATTVLVNRPSFSEVTLQLLYNL